MRNFSIYLWRFGMFAILVGLGSYLLGRYRQSIVLDNNNEVTLLIASGLFGAIFTLVLHNLKQGMESHGDGKAKEQSRLLKVDAELTELDKLMSRNITTLLFDSEEILREQVPLSTPFELFFDVRIIENLSSEQLKSKLHKLSIDLRTYNTEIRNLNKALDVINQAMLLGTIHQNQYEERVNVLRGSVSPLINFMKAILVDIDYSRTLIKLILGKHRWYKGSYKQEFPDALVQAEIAGTNIAKKRIHA
jgi:hypothetical protein